MRKTSINSHRTQRVSSLINLALVDALQRGKMLDERLLRSKITVTKVDVSPDLKLAKCYFIGFNTTMPKEALLEALEKSKYAIRSFVTASVKLKFSPELRFYYDDGFEWATRVQLGQLS